MSGLFAPKVKVPEPPGPPPTIDEAARGQDRTDQLRRRRGRAATILVPDGGMGSAPQRPAATILGG
jgi:hypothetical protein